jgi:hypothetical protein
MNAYRHGRETAQRRRFRREAFRLMRMMGWACDAVDGRRLVTYPAQFVRRLDELDNAVGDELARRRGSGVD